MCHSGEQILHINQAHSHNRFVFFSFLFLFPCSMQKETMQGARHDSELILFNQLQKVKDGKLMMPFFSFSCLSVSQQLLIFRWSSVV